MTDDILSFPGITAIELHYSLQDLRVSSFMLCILSRKIFTSALAYYQSSTLFAYRMEKQHLCSATLFPHHGPALRWNLAYADLLGKHCLFARKYCWSWWTFLVWGFECQWHSASRDLAPTLWIIDHKFAISFLVCIGDSEHLKWGEVDAPRCLIPSELIINLPFHSLYWCFWTSSVETWDGSCFSFGSPPYLNSNRIH